MKKLFTRIKCSFGVHEYIGKFALHDYVNSALEDKKLRYSSWVACKICGQVPRTAPLATPWDKLTKAEQDAKIALIQKPDNSAPGQ